MTQELKRQNLTESFPILWIVARVTVTFAVINASFATVLKKMDFPIWTTCAIEQRFLPPVVICGLASCSESAHYLVIVIAFSLLEQTA